MPRYGPAQLLVDGCAECELRAGSSDHGIGNLDEERFANAWHRAALWNVVDIQDVSMSEVPMLSVLWAVQVQLERRGVPIGEVPHGV